MNKLKLIFLLFAMALSFDSAIASFRHIKIKPSDSTLLKHRKFYFQLSVNRLYKFNPEYGYLNHSNLSMKYTFVIKDKILLGGSFFRFNTTSSGKYDYELTDLYAIGGKTELVEGRVLNTSFNSQAIHIGTKFESKKSILAVNFQLSRHEKGDVFIFKDFTLSGGYGLTGGAAFKAQGIGFGIDYQYKIWNRFSIGFNTQYTYLYQHKLVHQYRDIPVGYQFYKHLYISQIKVGLLL